jgi:hypothetical protein
VLLLGVPSTAVASGRDRLLFFSFFRSTVPALGRCAGWAAACMVRVRVQMGLEEYIHPSAIAYSRAPSPSRVAHFSCSVRLREAHRTGLGPSRGGYIIFPWRHPLGLPSPNTVRRRRRRLHPHLHNRLVLSLPPACSKSKPAFR